MAIIAITGKPGAGKSYAAVARGAKAHSEGIPIWTDLPLHGAGLAAWSGRRRYRRRKPVLRRIPRRQWPAFVRLQRIKRKGLVPMGFLAGKDAPGVTVVDKHAFGNPETWKAALQSGVDGAKRDGKKVRGVLIIVDEIATKLRGSTKGELAQILTFLETHRHYHATVMLCMQSHTQLDELRQIKALVEQWVEIVNFRLSMGISAYERRVYTSWYDKPGAKREPISITKGRFKQEIFDCYRSHAMSEGSEGEQAIEGVEEVQKIGGNLLTRSAFKIAIVVVIMVGGFFAAMKAPDFLEGLFGFGSGLAGTKKWSEPKGISKVEGWQGGVWRITRWQDGWPVLQGDQYPTVPAPGCVIAGEGREPVPAMLICLDNSKVKG